MADYRAYVDCQVQVDSTFRDPAHWTRMSILNVARMGKFSSDRAIREYADKIWCVQPLTAESTEVKSEVKSPSPSKVITTY
jgi:starch phosphorylase